MQGNSGPEKSLNHQEHIITLAFQSNKCEFQQIFIEHLLCAHQLLGIPRKTAVNRTQPGRGWGGGGRPQARKQVIVFNALRSV